MEKVFYVRIAGLFASFWNWVTERPYILVVLVMVGLLIIHHESSELTAELRARTAAVDACKPEG